MKSNRKRNVARKAKSNRSQYLPSSNYRVQDSPPGAGSRKPEAGSRKPGHIPPQFFDNRKSIHPALAMHGEFERSKLPSK